MMTSMAEQRRFLHNIKDIPTFKLVQIEKDLLSLDKRSGNENLLLSSIHQELLNRQESLQDRSAE